MKKEDMIKNFEIIKSAIGVWSNDRIKKNIDRMIKEIKTSYKAGFYYVKFREENEFTIGKFNGNDYYGWDVIGSDEPFHTEDLIIGEKIK